MSAASDTVPKRKRQSTKHIDPDVLNVRRKIQFCCSTDDLETAMTTFQQALQHNTKVEPQTFYNLLNLCDGLRDKGIHIGTPRSSLNGESATDTEPETDELNLTSVRQREGKGLDISPQQRKIYAFMIKEYMDSQHLPLVETAYTALIKIMCRTGDLDHAETILNESERCEQCKPRLRLYSPLLVAYAEKGDMYGALRIWSKMSKVTQGTTIGGEENIQPSEREFYHLILCAIKSGDIRVMERVLSEIGEDIFIPSRMTTEAIILWFQSVYSITKLPPPKNSQTLIQPSAFDQVDIPISNISYNMGPVHHNCLPHEKNALWEAHRCCKVDTTTGILEIPGLQRHIQLRPVDLTDHAWNEMLVMNESLVLKGEVDGDFTKYAGGGKGKKRVATEALMQKRALQWTAFKRFLEDQVGPLNIDMNQKIMNNASESKTRYDVIIDGANVGYYKQNFCNAPKHVDYQQIDWMVDHFIMQKKRVLLVLHERHFSNYLMPSWAIPLADKWRQLEVLYRTPAGSNDDWFWMHAALWCGRETFVLSNDEMRDHHFQMLAYRSFERWKERHQVHFSFGAWTADGKRREVELKYPDVYSRRMQRLSETSLAIPLPKRGDKNRFLDGTHDADETFPVDEEYVYICLKTDMDDSIINGIV